MDFATGRCICTLADDDLLFTYALELLLKVAKKDKNIDWIISPALFVYEEQLRKTCYNLKRYSLPSGVYIKYLDPKILLCHKILEIGVIIKRELICNLRYDDSVWTNEDILGVQIIMKNSKIAYINIPIMLYVQHSNSIMANYLSNIPEKIKGLEKYLKLYHDIFKKNCRYFLARKYILLGFYYKLNNNYKSIMCLIKAFKTYYSYCIFVFFVFFTFLLNKIYIMFLKIIRKVIISSFMENKDI